MTLRTFSATDFRCLASVSLELDPHYNLIYGANASGKTSILEAIAYLGRGKSFRSAPTERLIRHGASQFLLFGRVADGARTVSLGVGNSREGLDTRVDGERGGGAAALASVLPLQIVDPEVHSLVAGGPEERRRYLDWMAFHVEHGYLELWRRFRRVLKQRNAALREPAGPAALAGWDREFLELALKVHEVRERMLALAQPALLATGMRLVGSGVGFEYQRGWASDRTLAQALADGRDQDLALGRTRAGPQRADLRLSFDARQARKLVSRGQQKLLACTMVLAAAEVVQSRLERPLLLLLDDPAAELDAESLERFMTAVAGLGCQVVATALHPGDKLFPESPTQFHVEQGTVRAVA